MKTLFIDKRDKRSGSARVWIHNLRHWFSELGYSSGINDGSNYSDYGIVIFGKGTDLKSIVKVKSQNPNIICGLINPTDIGKENKRTLKELDFFIVGSIEEKDYYLRYSDNVFIFPLIEKLFKRQKQHSDHSPIILGYNGNLPHLNEFYPYLKEALEILAKEVPIKLIAIYDKKYWGQWRLGRPDIDIEDIQWDINTLEKELLNCDIGLVPGLVPTNDNDKKNTPNGFTAYANDYILRFKNTSNAGRAFVFHQLGIPVIADFIPSNFQILANPKYGFLAHHTEGWLHALRILCSSAKTRQEIADEAFKEFNRLYDPLDWSKRLHGQIQKLWNKKRHCSERKGTCQA